jgi:hypothetical protein
VTEAQTQPRLRRLRVFAVVVAAFKYCWKDARRLFLLTWLACALAAATRVLLEWLVYSWPPVLPGWMLANEFDPPTWLTAFVVTPWQAMGWAFVLNEMFHEHARRGTIKTPRRELGWLRFEISRSVLIAAAIFTAVLLIEAAFRWIQFEILNSIRAAYEPSDRVLTICSGLLTAVRIALMIIVLVWCYPLAGRVLQTGAFSIARIRQIMRGNWLRVALIFLLLNIALRGLDTLVALAASFLVSWTYSTAWTVGVTLVLFLTDFLIQMLWIVAWAVTVGIVLHTLDPSTTATEHAGKETAA